MWVFFVLIRHVLCFKEKQLLLIASEKTSSDMLGKFSDQTIIVKSNFYELYHSFESLADDEFLLLVDISNDKSYINIFDTYSTEKHMPYITLSIMKSKSNFSGRYSFKSSLFDQFQKLSNLIKLLGWEEYSVLYSSNPQDIELSDLIKQQSKDNFFSFISYSEDITDNNADILIRTLVKAKGIRKLLIIDTSSAVATIQTAIKNRNLLKAENYFLFVTDDIRKIYIEGALVMSTQGQEKSESYEEYIKITIDKVINSIKLQESIVFEIYDIMKKIYPNNVIREYSLYNIQGEDLIEVGVYNDDFEIIKEIIYPGNITYVSQEKKTTPIRFSMANGTSELTTNETFKINADWYRGSIYAVYKSNLLKEIPNFMIELFPTDCGNMYYEFDLSYECFKPIIDQLGVVYLTSGWGVGALGNAITLKSFNKFIPQISPTVQVEQLGNKTFLPEFIKLTVSLNESISNAFYLMRAFNWHSCNIFVSSDPIHYAFYPQLLIYLQDLKFTFANSEDKRIIPKNYTRKDFEKYRSYFEEAKNNRCRVYFIYALNFDYILEGLYDVGLRKGDVIIISSDISSIDAANADIEEQYMNKRAELIEGTFVISYKEWNGELGKQLYKEMSAKFQSVSRMCMTYDAVTVAKETIKYLIQTGNDYEDLELIAKTMRNSKVLGCLGNIYFAKDSNSRESALFIFQQILKNKTSNEWYYQDIIVIDKYSSTTMVYLADIVWPTGNFSSSTLFRPKLKCPFDSYMPKLSSSGITLFWCMTIFIFITTMIANYFSYKHYSGEIISLVQEKSPTLSDLIFLTSIYINFVQFFALAPSNNYFKSTFKNVFVLLSLNFLSYFDVYFSNFWFYIYFLLSFCAIWISICIIVSKNLHIMLRSLPVFGKIKDLSQTLFPFIANVSLIPVLSMLLEVFICKETIGDNLTDSFLSRDCTTFCYEGFHMIIAIIVMLFLLAFIGCIVYYRSMWEKIQGSLNLGTKPGYLNLLSMFQVFIVIFENCLKIQSQKNAGVATSVSIFVLLLFSVRIQPYNYTRLNRIWFFLLSLALWHNIICTIFLEVQNFYMWMLGEYIGLAIITAIFTLYIKKAPMLLKGGKSIKVTRLLLFQFGKVESKYVFKDRKKKGEDFSRR
ncbi:hypothetical protein SteCoe_37407 [Stentor coeruleus]|uniref:Uncharacterized protein n=1 Tax=Stentor coeruleus TaxID=5963 RepID=A0A1R2AN21_9CILI|nr:hypothetical protein SteCoe_37407 [Stentor coeruleus]